jgi:hypothetical protein
LPSNAVVVTVASGMNAPVLAVALAAGPAVTLSWSDNSVGETGYTVQRDTETSFSAPVDSYPVPSYTQGGAVSFVQNAAALTLGATYYYRVVANGAPSQNSNMVTAGAPPLPTGVTATQAAAAGSKVTISWTDNAPSNTATLATSETSFTIEKASSATPTTWVAVGTRAILSGTGLASFQETTAPVAGSWTYRVRANGHLGLTTAWVVSGPITVHN